MSAAHAQPKAGDWPTYGHDPGGMRFSPLTQITPANVAGLREAWVYKMRPDNLPASSAPTGFGAGRFAQSQVTPLVVDGMMYITTPYRRVVALDPSTGKELWVHEGQAPTRGVEYWPGDKDHGPRLVYGVGADLVALDARTGKPAAGFGDNGVLKATGGGASTSPPSLYRNLVISGTANPNNDGRNGDIRAFDIVTGQQAWRFDTIPQKDQPFYDTWASGSAEKDTGVRVWGLMTVDVERGIVYAPLKAPMWDRYGGHRHGDNLFGSSIVALDAASGRYLWHFQIVRHDVWDFDPAAPPMLFDVNKDGRTIPAVGLISKSGLLFILDRVTGAPIHGVEDRPVPASDIPGEQLSPTQPFPVAPPPIGRQTMSRAEIATVTPELNAYCTNLVDAHDIGMGGPYMPPGYNRPTVNFPGTQGSVNWGGMSFSPQLGLAFVNSHDLGQITGISQRGAPRQVIGVAGAGSGNNPDIPYDMAGLLGRFKEPTTNMMCQEPPWGRMTAIDVNSGQIAWETTLGVTDSLPADKQRTGRPNLGGSIVTASGLVFIGATDDGRFRAFDARTGAELWTVKLRAPNHSVPVTYLGADGKQYLAFPTTGGSFLQDPAADDSLVAYALP